MRSTRGLPIALARAPLVGLVLIAAVLAACSSPPASAQVSAAASAQQGTEAVVCAGLGAMQASVDALKALDPAAASREEYEQAVAEVIAQWRVVEDLLPLLQEANRDLLSTSWDSLKGAVDAQPAGIPPASAAAAVKPEAEAMATAVKSVFDGLDCA
jgi:hypothetical protein